MPLFWEVKDIRKISSNFLQGVSHWLSFFFIRENFCKLWLTVFEVFWQNENKFHKSGKFWSLNTTIIVEIYEDLKLWKFQFSSKERMFGKILFVTVCFDLTTFARTWVISNQDNFLALGWVLTLRLTVNKYFTMKKHLNQTRNRKGLSFYQYVSNQFYCPGCQIYFADIEVS